jgi:hypothetical protein
MYKPRSKHVVANALSILLANVKFVRVQNQAVDFVLFIAQPIWLREVGDHLNIGKVQETLIT